MIKTIYNFNDRSQPLLALAIHNGNILPPEIEANCGIEHAERLREEDPFTEMIAEQFINHIIVYTSRFAVDLNRSESKAVYLRPEDCWGLNVRKVELPQELLQAMYNAYNDWYVILNHYLSCMLMQHDFVVVFDLHSYNHHRLGPQADYDPPAENPDIILGRSNMPSGYYPLIDTLRERIDGMVVGEHSIDCRIDVKFTGGNLSRWLHANFPKRVMSISIEFKKFFMDEWIGTIDLPFYQTLIKAFYDKANLWLKDDLGFPTFNKTADILWKN